MFRRNRAELLSIALFPLGIGLALQGQLTTDAPDEVLAGPVSYTRQVAPIFQDNCVDCHGGETTEVELDLTTYDGVMAGSEYGTVIEAGDPDASLLLDMISAGEMPQEADALEEEQVELIRAWIEQGAQNN
jgi:mono/diheme cytochrome c family protein